MECSDREYVVQHMRDERDKNIARRMKSLVQLARIADLIRAVERMKRYGGVLIRDGQDYHDDDDDDLHGYSINMYGFNGRREFVILGNR